MTNRLNFTKAAIQALPKPRTGNRTSYMDTKVGGLQLRVTSSGTKTFCVYRRVKRGEPERVTLGRFPDVTVGQARDAALGISSAMAKGENPAATLRKSRGELTLGEMFQEYLDRHAIPHGKKTVDDMRANFRRYLTPLESRRLSKISHADVQKLINKLGVKNGHATANRALELLRAIFNRALQWKLYDDTNPATGIEKFKIPSRDRFLQADEFPRFFKALTESDNHTIRDFVLMSLLTGARRANVLGVRWDQISFERAEWRIPETKNGTPQTVTLTGEAVEILKARRGNGSEWVFPGDGKTGHLVSPKKGWKSLFDQDELQHLTGLIHSAGGTLDCEPLDSMACRLAKAQSLAKKMKLDTSRARIQDLRLHDLRRTMGSWQAKTGASLAIIGKSLHHKSVAATQVYARLDTDPVRESMERATSAMLTAAGLKTKAALRPLKRKSA